MPPTPPGAGERRLALASLTAAVGPDDPSTILAVHALGPTLHRSGALAEAETRLRTALTAWAKGAPQSSRRVAKSRLALADLLMERDPPPDEVGQLLALAWPVEGATGDDPEVQGDAAFVYARWHVARSDLEAAARFGKIAHDAFIRAGRRRQDTLVELERLRVTF